MLAFLEFSFSFGEFILYFSSFILLLIHTVDRRRFSLHPSFILREAPFSSQLFQFQVNMLSNLVTFLVLASSLSSTLSAPVLRREVPQGEH